MGRRSRCETPAGMIIRISKVEFDPRIIEIKKAGEWLRLELEDFKRAFSSPA
jgi:hypothetical protein